MSNQIQRSCRIPNTLWFVLLLSFLPADVWSGKIHDASWQKTFELYQDVPCLSPDQVAYGGEIITGLSYNSKRVFRQISQMEGIDFEKSKKAWEELTRLKLSYEQVLSFERWSALEGVTVDLAFAALPAIHSLSYEAGKSFREYCRLPRITPDHALKTIPLLNRLDDSQNRAAQGLLAIEDINGIQALDGLGVIALLRKNRAMAAEAFARIKKMNIATMEDAFPLIRVLHQDDAWNAKTLLFNEAMTPEEGWFWLTAYFANPTNIQEQQFHKLSSSRKKALVQAFYDSGEELIWKINNLHAVTDRFGFEISNSQLKRYSVKQLQERFEALSPQIKSRFGNQFYGTGSKNSKISTLKKATSAERSATAKRLTSANIYALLSQGSELYDSSFRNILVPVLKNYVEKFFSNNLLVFINATDPGNRLVSNFIVSLAQKGKLTTFFPDNSREQEQILELVAQSAFKNEESIILFSATFMYLLEVLEPSARTFLLNKMSQQADLGTATYARLITVILQYYLQEYPQLLSAQDKSLITRLIVRHGAINLHSYLATPFDQWKTDSALNSVSVFHPDDDGRDSFLSNARMLLKSGYRVQLSDTFTIGSLSDQIRKEIISLTRSAMNKPTRTLPILFNSMQRRHYAISFVRELNGITINHAAFVYSGDKNQEKLLERFVLSKTEMFAQRGHSYWRSEQITDPMLKLLDDGRLTETHLKDKQRFFSLGSCGGVKAYTRLSRMFLGHIDILATIGTGLAVINDPYNKSFFEVIAKSRDTMTWKDMATKLAFIFKGGHGRDYLQPGSLPAILHKIIDEDTPQGLESSARENGANSGDQGVGS